MCPLKVLFSFSGDNYRQVPRPPDFKGTSFRQVQVFTQLSSAFHSKIWQCLLTPFLSIFFYYIHFQAWCLYPFSFSWVRCTWASLFTLLYKFLYPIIPVQKIKTVAVSFFFFLVSPEAIYQLNQQA